MLTRSICLGMLVLLPFYLALAQNEATIWTSLDGPYWANGIDVAIGDDASSLGKRYLIGSDNNLTRVYRWDSQQDRWAANPFDRPGAEKVISYRKDGSANGLRAFCASFEDDVYQTIDGGQNWGSYNFSGTNNLFSSVEIINWAQIPGQTVIVGMKSQTDQPSAYYTDDYGNAWLKLGATSDPLDNWDVHDIETLPDEESYPVITAGTANGIYKHSGAWGTSWTQVAFFAGLEVSALESLDGWVDSESQVAAVNDNGTWKLYLTTDSWYTNPPPEIKSSGQSFSKEVLDIAAVYWGGVNDKISCHVATTEGVYILHFSANDPGNATEIDLKNYANPEEDPYWPLQYDKNIISIDYCIQSYPTWTIAFVLATTPYNVYEILERRLTRDYSLMDITTTEIVTGTFLSNVVALSFPENTEDQKLICTMSEEGVIKKLDDIGWNLIGLGFEPDGEIWYGADIATDFEGTNQYILVSCTTSSDGSIMYSSDGGDTWEGRTPAGHPKVTSVDFEPGADPNEQDAYAACFEHVWRSTNNGFSWTENYYFSGADFNDVMAEPSSFSSNEAYVGGTEVYRFDGSTWYEFDDGFPSGTVINQFERSRHPAGAALFAATDRGVYKNISGTWFPNTYGTGAVAIGSIAYNRRQSGFGFYEYLISAPSDIIPPETWASGDSGRSWRELYHWGIEEDVSIYTIAEPQSGIGGFAAGTSEGVLYIGQIFKRGGRIADEDLVWGPGYVMINSDLLIIGHSYQSPVTFTIVPPCTVLVVYDFNTLPIGQDPDRVEIWLWGVVKLDAIGEDNNRIVFTSSRPGGGIESDWYGIVIEQITAGNLGIRMEYCDLEYAYKSISTSPGHTVTVDSLILLYSNFTAGKACIDVDIMVLDSCIVTESNFTGGNPVIGIIAEISAASFWLSSNEIVDGDWGIAYLGNWDSSYESTINIEGNVIQGGQGGEVSGISIGKFDPENDPPVAIINDNTVTDFDYGIYLNSASEDSELRRNTVHDNNYGLFLASSSPRILAGPGVSSNTFRNNNIGIYCDANSGPHVKRTRIKDNSIGGVLIESHDISSAPLPDFGTESDWGYNSISRRSAPEEYYDMKYVALLTEVPARGNWWGEPPPPDPDQIIGNIDSSDPLDYDPLPGGPKPEPPYANLPEDFGLRQNFPNPFNPTTSLSFYIAEPGFASLKIYNLNGQLVNTLVSHHLASGEHTVIWDGMNSAGMDVASGIYFYILKTDYGNASKKMVLLR